MIPEIKPWQIWVVAEDGTIDFRYYARQSRIRSIRRQAELLKAKWRHKWELEAIRMKYA